MNTDLCPVVADALEVRFFAPSCFLLGNTDPQIKVDLNTGEVTLPAEMTPNEAAARFWECVELFANTEMGRLREEIARLKGEGDETVS